MHTIGQPAQLTGSYSVPTAVSGSIQMGDFLRSAYGGILSIAQAYYGNVVLGRIDDDSGIAGIDAGEFMNGGDGNDRLLGSGGNDIMDGDAGRDITGRSGRPRKRPSLMIALSGQTNSSVTAHAKTVLAHDSFATAKRFVNDENGICGLVLRSGEVEQQILAGTAVTVRSRNIH